MALSFTNRSLRFGWVSFSRIVRSSCARHNEHAASGVMHWKLPGTPISRLALPGFKCILIVFRDAMQPIGLRLRLIWSETFVEEKRNDFYATQPFAGVVPVHCHRASIRFQSGHGKEGATERGSGEARLYLRGRICGNRTASS